MSEQIVIKIYSITIQHLVRSDDKIDNLILKIRKLKYTLHDDNPYGFLVYEILEQMLFCKVTDDYIIL